MDALRRAEADKQQLAERPPSADRADLQLERLERPVAPGDPSAPAPADSAWPSLVPLVPTPNGGPVEPSASRVLGSIAHPTVVAADTLFEATRTVGVQRWLVGVIGVFLALALGLGAVGVYVWRQAPVVRPLPSPRLAAELELARPPAPAAPPSVAPRPNPPALVAALAPIVGVPPTLPRPALAEARPAREIHITKSPGAPVAANDLVARAYAAFTAGQLAQARTLYLQALADTPERLDVQLGLAALALSEGALPEARRRYLAVLTREPRNATATAALLLLEGGAGAADAETRLRQMLRADPDDPHAQFTLGSYYAQAQRWAEAQTAFFAAATRAPENADYAFNLAVSLDRLGQGAAALTWYRKALALRVHGGTFAPTAATTRVAQLGGEGTTTP